MTKFASVLKNKILNQPSQVRRLNCAVEFFLSYKRSNKIRRLTKQQIKQGLKVLSQIIPLLDGDDRDDMIYIFELLNIEMQDRKERSRKTLITRFKNFIFQLKQSKAE